MKLDLEMKVQFLKRVHSFLNPFKTNYQYVLIILFFSINHIVNAQVTPIETIITNKKTL